MNIGLIDVDSHNFPNLALMKISAYHKSIGDNVSFVDDFGSYDTVYKSKVFTFSKEDEKIYSCDNIISGGTGYNLDSKLPKEIESMSPDYSLYNYDYAVGYLTRGCPRRCPFCIVAEKEGTISYKVSDLNSFWNGQKEIKLLDPNITACKDLIPLLNQLIDSKASIDFTQGLDIRFMTDEVIDMILQMNVKTIHFAYDRMNQSQLIEKRLSRFREKTGYGRNKVSVFVLVNYETTIEEDMHRLDFIRSVGFRPYVMIYDKHKLPYGKSVHPRLQRWVNNVAFFYKYKDFNEYQQASYKHVL